MGPLGAELDLRSTKFCPATLFSPACVGGLLGPKVDGVCLEHLRLMEEAVWGRLTPWPSRLFFQGPFGLL